MARHTLAPKAARRRTPRTRHHSTRTSSRGRCLYRRPLRLEPLEDRRLLAVVTVDTLTDTIDFNDGVTSLREAIFATNTVPGADAIEFAESLFDNGPATILLTQGELAITDSLTINGPGAELLTIDASGNDPTPEEDNGDGSRIFNVDDGDANQFMSVSIAGLTLIGGDVAGDGGALLSRENVLIAESVVHSNSALRSGGGIHSAGTLSLIDSTVSKNSASGRGGGINAYYVTLSRTLISENSTQGTGGGAAVALGLEMSDSVVKDNFAANGGGGILSGAFSSSSTIYKSTVSGNVTDIGSRSFRGGGGILNFGTMTIKDSLISDNVALGESAGGGGILSPGGFTQLSLIASTVSGNSADGGGGGILVTAGIFGGGQLTLTGSTISGNNANYGGGLDVNFGYLTIDRSNVNANEAAVAGGGIRAIGSRIRIGNSTVSGNSAALGGGVFAAFFQGSIDHSTIAFNQATGSGNGLFLQSGALGLNHTILAANAGTLYGDASVVSDASLVTRFSLIGRNDGTTLVPAPVGAPDANGNLIGGALSSQRIDPRLLPLADNGGPTMTHALLPGSPAIDAGDPNAEAGVDGVPVHDQRGVPFTRVYGGRIDIGAVEAQPVDVLAGDFNANGVINAADNTVWRDTLGQLVTNGSGADGNGDGVIDLADHRLWAANFGATTADLPPQPGAAATPLAEPNASTAEGFQVATLRGTVPFFSADSAKLGQSPNRDTKMGTDPVPEPVAPVPLAPASVERALGELLADSRTVSSAASRATMRPTNRITATVADDLLLLLVRSPGAYSARDGAAAAPESPGDDRDASGNEPIDAVITLGALLTNVAL